MSYRVLALPERSVLSLPVLRKLKDLVAAGATVIGPKPTEASGLQDYPKCDQTLRALADDLYGGGGIITNQTTRQVLQAKGLPADFAWIADTGAKPEIDFIHRAASGTEIYFVMNRSSNAVALDGTFRVRGRAPELWDAVSGEHHFAPAYSEKDGCTTLPLHFNPCGSIFVIFREPAAQHPSAASDNWPDLAVVSELSGPWTVHFDPHWGGPDSVIFDKLESWTLRAEPGIKYYSGTAVYRRTFTLPAKAGQKIFLELGDVRELAEVKVNGHSCGIAWTPPFRVDITGAGRAGENSLEIEVVNFWPNRIIGDQFLPPSQRLTRTNIRKLTKTTPLMESGLLGPVRLLSEK
jgi:hypothetical protein